ncbi:MAG: bifunctional diaminohydroxyphosphoribosylaminopyrimidine deaminase/5-amino-6-(5-phosphoribosylamino)uracil reductase RibD [Burkholderiaceae bacterium]
MIINQDREFMRQAIKMATKGVFSASPNPRVGCVIVKDSKVIGKGGHITAGKEHAEIIALKEAGLDAEGSSVYTTLEPCNTSGKTPPCTHSLINAKVSRVIVAMKDPNPNVNGGGISDLIKAGISVTYGVLEVEAINLNLGFIKRMKYGQPWVRAKVAMSMDGFIALLSGDSKWITRQQARKDGHKWRARSCMIMTGIGTLRKDNPQLNVRSVKTSRQPTKVLIDSKLELDINYSFFDSSQTIVFTSVNSNYDDNQKKQFKDKNIEILKISCNPKFPNHLDLRVVLKELAARGCNELHLEAGAKLSGSFMQENLIDECLIYVAPIFLGKGLPVFQVTESVKSLFDASKWAFSEVVKLGDDLRIILRPCGFDPLGFFHKDSN